MAPKSIYINGDIAVLICEEVCYFSLLPIPEVDVRVCTYLASPVVPSVWTVDMLTVKFSTSTQLLDQNLMATLSNLERVSRLWYDYAVPKLYRGVAFDFRPKNMFSVRMAQG